VRTMTRAVVLALAAAMAASAMASAQEQVPECRNLRYRSNFRLNGAQQYLTRARTTSFPDQKRAALNDAARVLGEAAQDRGADQATLWYLFGQMYALRGDLVGTDSAWTRAEAATDAECRRAIQRERAALWVPLVQEGAQLASQNSYDSALVLLRKANTIYRDDPRAYFTMGQTFYAQEKLDSAIVYFRRASTAGTAPQQADTRATAGMNAARLAQQADQLPVAESLYRAYAQLRPRDVEGITRLAGVLVAQGRNDEASRIYDSLLTNADSMAPADLFDLGVALYNQRRLPLAARAFEANVRKSPYDRDGQYNLANVYLAMSDTVRTLEAAKRLVVVDPHNRQSLQLLASAYSQIGRGLRDQALRAQAARDTATVRRLNPQVRAYQDSTVRALAQSDSLDWEIRIARFEPRDSTAGIQGMVRNLQAGELAGFNLVLDFVNGAGEVLATERVEIPTLSQAGNPGSAYDFNLTASARGILAYRYRQN